MRMLLVLGLGVSSLLLPATWEGGRPRVVVLSGEDHIRRLADVKFSRRKPPPGLREDAMTRCQVDLQSEVPRDQAGLRWKPGSCRAEAHVEEVRVRVRLTIEVFLPKGAPQVLRAHEEGHARLCREVFKTVAEPVARRAYASFPTRFPVSSEEKCSAVELQELAFRKLHELDVEPAQQVQDEIMQELEKARLLFDRLTDLGRRDGHVDGPPTVHGQQNAAERVIRELAAESEKEGGGKGTTTKGTKGGAEPSGLRGLRALRGEIPASCLPLAN